MVPANITLQASVSDSDGSVTMVEFFEGSSSLGQDTVAPYEFTWNNVQTSTYSLTAVVTDNDGLQTTSEIVNITVADVQYNMVQKGGIVIDGNLSDWNSVNGETFSGDSGRGARDNTVIAKAAWDNTYMYLSYNVTDTELISVYTTPDSFVYRDDVLELFIDTDFDGGTTMQTGDFHIMINIDNVLADTQGTGGSQDWSWNATGLLSAVSLNGTLNDGAGDTGYTIEVAIPWASMGVSPTEGQQIAVDFAAGDADTGDGYQPFDWAGIRPFTSHSFYHGTGQWCYSLWCYQH